MSDQPEPPPSVRPVQYKGEPLDAERGPGLGCFRFQLATLAALVVLTPLSVVWGWPEWVSAALLFVVIVLLLAAGQTIIFLLRLVAADRRAAGRRRPLASPTKTIGELEDERDADAPLAERGERRSPGTAIGEIEDEGPNVGTPADERADRDQDETDEGRVRQ